MVNFRRLVPLSLASCLALGAPLTVVPSASFAQGVLLSITVAPPPLPIYVQPAIPEIGYIWAPGYWAWGPGAYYWVPGTWVLPPAVGLLWTPSYWAWSERGYLWHPGYWAPRVGFYGGINYGFGYTGAGYTGGRWDNGAFFYNRAVNNFGGTHVSNVYNEPVRTTNVTRVSFNGGQGGTHAQATAEEQNAAQDRHTEATPLQAQHEHAAAGNHAALATVNHGRPAIAATPRPASFAGPGVVGSRGAGAAHPAHPPHIAEERPVSAPAAPEPSRSPQPGPASRVEPQHASPSDHPGQEHATQDHGEQQHDRRDSQH